VTVTADFLRTLSDVRIVFPGDADYDTARAVWNLAVDQRPAAIAFPTTIAEVAAVVRAARAVGLRVTPQGTGHGAGPFHGRNLDDVVLVRLTELAGLWVDPVRRTAVALAGTLWDEVIAATAPHGLTALHGSAGDAGVAGYLLGGGLSFYARRHGLASESVVSIEMVDAAGDLVRANREENPELFWALRGAGGSLGIVVSIEFELLPYADVVAGMLLWDRAHAEPVVRAWREWTATSPDSVTTSLRLMSFPPLPELPPFLSGRQVVVIDGAILEDDDRAAELLAPLRALAPELDTFGRVPSEALLGVHMDPPAPAPAVSDHALLGGLPDEAVEAFVAAAVSPHLTSAELRQLGGALSHPTAGGGQLPTAGAEYALFAVAMAPTPEAVEAGRGLTTAVIERLRPWATDRMLPTFAENAVAAERIYGGDLPRLLAAIGETDPEGVFVNAHRLPGRPS